MRNIPNIYFLTQLDHSLTRMFDRFHNTVLTSLSFNDETNDEGLLKNQPKRLLLDGKIHFDTFWVRFGPDKFGIDQLHLFQTYIWGEIKACTFDLLQTERQQLFWFWRSFCPWRSEETKEMIRLKQIHTVHILDIERQQSVSEYPRWYQLWNECNWYTCLPYSAELESNRHNIEFKVKDYSKKRFKGYMSDVPLLSPSVSMVR